MSLSMLFIGFLLGSSLIKLMFNWSHLILILLTFEFMVLSIYAAMALFSSLQSNSAYHSAYFLVIAICESALGLCLLTLFSRKSGGDMTLNKALLKW